MAVIASGGTARHLREQGLDVTSVSDVTGFPEIFGGRVKTLHPAIHGGILARRDLDSHQAQIREHGIRPIDLVVVNLYPFQETVARPDLADADAIEMIDIGGPSMVRSAAKNHADVAVVVDPEDYEPVLAEMESDGGLSAATLRRLATRGPDGIKPIAEHVCARL